MYNSISTASRRGTREENDVALERNQVLWQYRISLDEDNRSICNGDQGRLLLYFRANADAHFEFLKRLMGRWHSSRRLAVWLLDDNARPHH